MSRLFALVDCNSGFTDRVEAHACDLRHTVVQWTGIPVSVGIGPTKLLTKGANRFAKREPHANSVKALLDPAAQDDAPCTDRAHRPLGRRPSTGLKAHGRWHHDAAGAESRRPGGHPPALGVVLQRIVLELRGISCLPLELMTPDRKSIVSSRSFGRLITARADVEEAVVGFASRAAAKMRRQGLACGSLAVFVETNPLREQDPQYRASQGVTLPMATADTAKLIAAAQRGLARIWRQGFRYKKAGIMLLDLVKADTVGSGLFDRRDDAGSRARMRALDTLNGRFGRNAVTSSRQQTRPRRWRLRSDMLSARYTTHWDELLQV
jgi:DNA polymerase V